MAAGALSSVEPTPAYTALIDDQITIGEDHAQAPQRRSPLHPITATPVFDTPLVDRLRRLDLGWVCGGLDELAADSLCLMSGNRRFVEALVAGANHQLVRMLRWRRFPVDQRGTSFDTFWPGTPGVGDVKALRGWDAALGHNPPEGVADASITILLVRAELLRRYPSTIITLELGAIAADRFDFDRRATELFRGVLDSETSYVAYDSGPPPEVGDDGDPQWYVSLRQPIDESRFATTAQPSGGRGCLVPADLGTGRSSAEVARRLFRRPFRLLLPAADFVLRPDGSA